MLAHTHTHRQLSDTRTQKSEFKWVFGGDWGQVPGLEGFSVDGTSSIFFIFLFRNPHFLKGVQRGQDRATTERQACYRLKENAGGTLIVSLQRWAVSIMMLPHVSKVPRLSYTLQTHSLDSHSLSYYPQMCQCYRESLAPPAPSHMTWWLLLQEHTKHCPAEQHSPLTHSTSWDNSMRATGLCLPSPIPQQNVLLYSTYIPNPRGIQSLLRSRYLEERENQSVPPQAPVYSS